MSKSGSEFSRALRAAEFERNIRACDLRRVVMREHVIDGTPCWCDPDVAEHGDSFVVIHKEPVVH